MGWATFRKFVSAHDLQRDGTAVPSLGSEHLQEVELLSGPERQRAEEVIKNALGSVFQGEFTVLLRGWRAT